MIRFELPDVPPDVQRAVTDTTLAILARQGIDTKGGLVGNWFVFDKAPDSAVLAEAWREACAAHGVQVVLDEVTS